MTSRLYKVGDALSQLINVALLPRHGDTSANESVSGRAYRLGWTRVERLINWLFSPWERDHCRKAYEADRRRAEMTLLDLPAQDEIELLDREMP